MSFLVGKIVNVKASTAYGKIPIAAMVTDSARPIIVTSCLKGFNNLQCAFLHKIALHIEAVVEGLSLFDLIQCNAIKICDGVLGPKMTDDLMIEILNYRRVQFEMDEDLQELCEIEYMLDAFDVGDKAALKKEIDTAKARRTQAEQFELYVRAFKVM